MRIDVHHAVLKVVSYFHFFKYPVTKQEIWRYLPVAVERSYFEIAIANLETERVIFLMDGFYSLENNPDLVIRRLTGNQNAVKQLNKAYRIARFLGMFPFVESVYISGSLSKDFFPPDGDLDYFIVTAPNRLWIARSFMHFFKKITFLVNAQHSFCMNYYLGMENLHLDVKNAYTALELATLKPAYVHKGIEELYNANRYWVNNYLPNYDWGSTYQNGLNRKSAFTKFLEKIINNLHGDRINNFMYRFTKWKWIKKWSRKGFDVEKCLTCMDTYYNTPVNYPKNLMKVILDGSEIIYKEAEKSAAIKLNVENSYLNKATHKKVS